MDFDFSEEQGALREAVARWVDKGFGFERRHAMAQAGGASREVLGELADRAEEQDFASPSIVVLGEVVAQRVPGCAPEPAEVEMPIPF